MWEAVQLEMERRQVFAETHGMYKLDYATLDNPFAGKVICGLCSNIFGRTTWYSSNERCRKKVWICSNRHKIKGKKGCANKHIEDKVLYKTFINIFNAIIKNKDYFIEKWQENLKSESALVRYKAKQFIKIIDKAEPIKELNINLLFMVVEKMNVFEGKKFIVNLLDGTAVEVVIE